METKIEAHKYPRAKMGWIYCTKIIEHLGTGSYDITFVYSFEKHELLIIDPKLIEILDFLQIPYDLIKPSNAINYIKES